MTLEELLELKEKLEKRANLVPYWKNTRAIITKDGVEKEIYVISDSQQMKAITTKDEIENNLDTEGCVKYIEDLMENILRLSISSQIPIENIEISVTCLALCRNDFYYELTEEDEYGENIVTKAFEKAEDGDEEEFQNLHKRYLENTIYNIVPVIISIDDIPEIGEDTPILGDFHKYRNEFAEKFLYVKNPTFYVEFDEFIKALSNLGYKVTSESKSKPDFGDYENHTKKILSEKFIIDPDDIASYLSVRADFTKTKGSI